MAKNFSKFFINNLKEKKYLSNIQRVDFDKTKTDNNNILSDEQIKKRIDEINQYEIDLRHNNLRVYLENIIKFRKKQFLILIAPFALVASTAVSFIVPYRHVKTKSYNTYQREIIVLDKDRGQIIDNDDFYYSSLFENLEFVDAEHNHEVFTDNKRLEYHMLDGMDEFNAYFKYDENGKLYFNNVDVGKYINFNEYDFSHSTNIDEQFENLFDDVLVMLKEECDLDNEQLSVLNKLEKSEDKKIIITILKYTNIGEKSVEVYKTNFWLRTILTASSLIYGLILFKYTKSHYIHYGDELVEIEGRLTVNKREDVGLMHGALKYKEAFIKAEKERILNARELVDEYIIPEDRDKVFTKLERKL